MTIDTLAYAQALEAAGVDRRAAEVQVSALVKHVLPDLATKPDRDQIAERFENRVDQVAERFERRLD
jgi:hypothetical protein